MLSSLLVLGGWLWDVATLKAVLPGWVTMKPLTATGCFLAGAALCLLSPQPLGLIRRRLGQLSALMVIAIGALTLSEYLTGADYRIDLPLFRASVIAEGGVHPGRPAPSTSFCLLLVGIALEFVSLDKDKPVLWLALTVQLTAILALLGYAYGVMALYQIQPFTSIALHTAILLLLLSLGLLSARPAICADWLRQNLAGSLMVRKLLPAAIVLPLSVGWLQLQGQHAGYFDASFGSALFATFHIVVFSGLIFWTANLLNRADVAREAMLSMLQADISERKHAEKERDRFAALANASVEFIGMCNRHFESYYINPAGMRMIGLDNLAEACATRVQDFFFPEDQPFITDAFFPKVIQEGSGEVEIRFRHFKTGEAIWMLYNVFNLHDDDGNIIGCATVSRNITDRKRLEARFRAAIESTPNAMVMSDQQGRIVLVNSRTEEYFGYSRQDMLGQTVEFLMPERFRANHQPQRHAYAHAPESRPMGSGRELYGLRKDGTEFPIEIGLNPVNIDEGPFVLAAIVDITERKRTEAAYRESEERLRLLVEGVQDYAIFMLDTEGRVASWNVGAKRISGYETSEIIGRHFTCFYSPEDIADGKPNHEIASASADGRYQEEGVRVRKDGSRYWANVVLTALRDTQGNLRGFAKVTRDITEKKRAEEKILQINSELERRVAKRTQELEASNKRLQNELIERRRAEDEIERFFKMSVDMICIISAEGYLHQINPSFETTLGYTRAELTSRPLLDFMHPDDLEAARIELENLARGFSSIRFENRFRCQDGTYRWLGWTAQPAPDGTFYAIARDVTARKRYEDQIAASLHEKEVLLKEIHHRVKNNLQVISSLLRLQADTLEDPAARESFLDSQRRVRSMALVHEQLYRSSGLANISMSEYIASLVNYIRRSYNDTWSTMTVKTDIADIALDIERAIPLGLIVSELTANSCKHAFKSLPKDKTGTLWVKLATDDAGDLLLEVGDNGCGLPDDVDIDQPLSMGLHLVQSFVLQLHGRLTVQRRPHTLFSIVIPNKKSYA